MHRNLWFQTKLMGPTALCRSDEEWDDNKGVMLLSHPMGHPLGHFPTALGYTLLPTALQTMSNFACSPQKSGTLKSKLNTSFDYCFTMGQV